MILSPEGVAALLIMLGACWIASIAAYALVGPVGSAALWLGVVSGMWLGWRGHV